MATEKGYNVLFKIGATPAAVSGQREGTLTRNQDTIDATVKADFPNKTYTQGFTGWQMTCGNVVDLTDGGLTALEAAINVPAVVSVSFVAAGATWTGSANVTAFDYNAPLNDVMSASVTVQGTGALTKT